MLFNLPNLVWWEWLLVAVAFGLVSGFSWSMTTGRSGRSGFIAPLITFFCGVIALIALITGAIGFLQWMNWG
ncbi:MAG TPA: hypothetical protein VFO34_03525 [Candidatus Acidoferrales bacterium]|nr:hypothetical protein [Candidatus Acidoferrales bacterium]